MMRILGNSKGQTIVFVALFFVIILAFVGLAINTGLLTYVKNQGQAAVDASALAAAAAIPNYNTTSNPGQIYTLAGAFNSDNTVQGGSANIADADVALCTGNPFGSYTCAANPADPTQVGGVQVVKTYTSPVFLPGFLDGDTSKNLTVNATAWLGGPGGASPDLPVTVCGQDVGFDFSDPSGGNTCDPSMNADFTPNGTDNAGYWTPIGISANAQDCRNFVNNPDQIPFIHVGEDINLNNGQINSCHKEIEERFEEAGCFDSNKCLLANDDPAREACTVVLPVINCPGSINQQEPVQGFIALCITDVVSNPAKNAKIAANLTCGVELDQPNTGGGPQLGVYANHPVLVN